MSITLSGNGITSANIADGTITTDDINASDVKNLKSGRKNLIINGAMQVAQKGTSYTSSGAVTVRKTIDKYSSSYWGFTASNHTKEEQVTDAPDGFAYSKKYTTLVTEDFSSALGSACTYRFEGSDLLPIKNGTGTKAFTVSFWVKSNKTGNVSVAFEPSSGTSYSYATYVTINAVDTWEKKSVTIPASSNNMDIDYTSVNEQANFKIGLGSNGAWLVSTDNQWNDKTTARNIFSTQQTNFHASVNDYLAFTGVQLELGDTATDFEHRSFGEELALCQRYYQKSFKYSVAPANGLDWTNGDHSSLVTCNSGGNAGYAPNIAFNTAMRVAPTITLYNTTTNSGAGLWGVYNGSSWYNTSYQSVQSSSERGFGLQLGATFMTGAGSYITMGAWTADAEL